MIRFLAFLLLTSFSLTCLAQGQKTITGTLRDEATGNPIPSATVSIKGTKQAVGTDANGNFRLHTNSANPVLIFTSVGYEPQQIPYNGSDVVSVSLKSKNSALTEVVVTAFGQRQNTSKLPYASQQIGAKELATAPSPNVLNSLQGKLSGVRIDQGTGGAGSSSRIRIRGNTSLSGNQSPLFVIDGVLIKPDVTGPETWADNNNADFGNVLKNINEDDIESVSVLKGSAASALYGSGAQNGVVLITTKKGRAGNGLGVSFNITQMWDKVYAVPDLQYEYGGGISSTFAKDASGNDVVDPDNGPFYDFGPKLDGHMVKDLDGRMRPWSPYKVIDFFQTGSQTDYNVAVQGATDRSSFRASYSKNLTDGIIPNGAKFDRDNFSIRGTQKIGKIFDIDATITYAQTSNKNPIRQVSNYNPIFRFNYYRANTTDWNYYINNYQDKVNGGRIRGANDPYNVGLFLWTTFQNNQYSNEDNLRANIDLTTHLTPWLSLLTRGNLFNYNTKIEKKYLGDGAGFTNGYYGLSTTVYKSYRLQALLTASKQLTSDLQGSITLGAETNKDKVGDVLNANTNNGLSASNPYYFSLANSIGPVSVQQGYRPSKLTDAIYTYGDITWRDMLTLTYSVRNDYNSSLALANGSGNYTFVYPSVGASFLFGNLLKDKPQFNFLSFGQLRASYGVTGKDYDPWKLNQVGNYSIGGSDMVVNNGLGTTILPHSGFTSAILPNKNLKNEKTKEYEFGTNLRFFDNRLGIDFTYYTKSTYNQILELPVPPEIGGNSALFNVGQIRNRGIEILLNATPVRTKDFSWNFNVNFTRNHNTVVSLANGVASYSLLNAFGADVRAVAQPGKEYGAVYTTYGFAYYQAVDANGNPVANPSNGKRVLGNAPNGSDGYTFLRSGDYAPGLVRDKYLGTIMEKYLAGTYQTFRYKDFSLNVQVDAKVGGLMASGTHQYGSTNGAFAFTLPGRDAAHGGIAYTDANGNKQQDGIIPDGVFADGITSANGTNLGGMSWKDAYDKGLIAPKPAWQYYEDLTQWSSGIREFSVFDNSWVALREISVGYNLPRSIASKIKVNNLRVTLIGRNLTYIYKNAKGGINPEGLSSNQPAAFAEYGGIPYVRNIGFSVNADF
ncbi:MAG: SusC/RagA family TonB-linked outer membrane protein [Bacteroidota bacterium]|nr:SusC/RagA family TonB-linked outer membrane protein [Bacteroidota bacterium]